MSAGQYVDVGSIARTVLDGVVAHWAPLAPAVTLPDRRFIAPGDPRQVAWDDCEMLFVTCAGILPGQSPGAGAGARQTGNPVSVGARHAVFAVQIVRCLDDDGDPPAPDVLTEAGLALLRDAGLLSQALVELCGRTGALRSAGSAVAGAVEILGPSGGRCAVEGSLTVTAGNLV